MRVPGAKYEDGGRNKKSSARPSKVSSLSGGALGFIGPSIGDCIPNSKFILIIVY